MAGEVDMCLNTAYNLLQDLIEAKSNALARDFARQQTSMITEKYEESIENQLDTIRTNYLHEVRHALVSDTHE